MADLKEDTGETKSSIIMKVDAPPEDNNRLTSPGGSMNNLDEHDTAINQMKPKKSLLASPKLNSNSFLSRSSVLSSPKLNSGVVLRPSALGAKLENKSEHAKNPFTLNPSRLNPFAKPESTNNGSTECEEDEKKKAAEPSNGSASVNDNTTANSNSADTPKFVPLAVTEPSTRVSTTSVPTTAVTSAPNFVFGQNLHERVIAEAETSSEAEPVPSTSCTNANGTSELLFSSAVKSSAPTDSSKGTKSLTESAREYEESRANKRKYEEVVIVTGEEDEKNVLQINCKLFAFDKSGNWQERGRGTLRLNDKEVVAEDSTTYTQSRLVIRTTGSLRVVLNTKIWAEMTIDRANLKGLRLTAMDANGQIKVFLIMASAEEINQLQRMLETRVRNETERQQQLKSANSEPNVKKQAIEASGQ